MNKYLTLLALLACATVANAACHADAVDVSGTCYCKQGYWGTDASDTTGDCAACTGNTDTDAPGATNTGASINVSACKKCVAGYFMGTAATASAAAVCSSCNTSSAGSTNDGATAAGDAA